MSTTIDTSEAGWLIGPQDDPQFIECAERVVAVVAMQAQLPHIVVVHLDNWFGDRWLRYPHFIGRRKRRSNGLLTFSRFRDSPWLIPPFHPHRVLSEQRFELREDGSLIGPFESAARLHRQYEPNAADLRRLNETCPPGVYAWCSGNTAKNDRGALMAYTHVGDNTSGWYMEFRRADNWRPLRCVGLSNLGWRQLLDIAGVSCVG